MPHLAIPLSPAGAIVVAFAGVSHSRRIALEASGQPVPQPVQLRALIDTGASCTCVDTAVLAPLQLSPTGQTTISTPSTGQQPAAMDQFDVLLAIPGPTAGSLPLIFPTIPIVALRDFANPAYDALIGRDILGECILHYNGATGLFELAY